MKNVLIAALAALVVSASGAVIAQQSPIKKEQLVGSWTLVSLDLTVDGKKSQPFGSPPKGYMNLDRNGTYSILLFRPGTPGFAAKNRLKGTDAEYKAVGQNSQAYYGTYKVNEKDGVMDLRVEHSTYPNHDGSDQKRFLKLSGDELRVSNPATPTGGTAEVVWKRIK
jgi:hypothetical protein